MTLPIHCLLIHLKTKDIICHPKARLGKLIMKEVTLLMCAFTEVSNLNIYGKDVKSCWWQGVKETWSDNILMYHHTGGAARQSEREEPVHH